MGCVVRKARLELARVTPPDPKPGASTNSATFASEQPRSITQAAARFAFAHQQAGDFAQRRQAVFQHEVKRAVAGERRALARRVHPGPGPVLVPGLAEQGNAGCWRSARPAPAARPIAAAPGPGGSARAPAGKEFSAAGIAAAARAPTRRQSQRSASARCCWYAARRGGSPAAAPIAVRFGICLARCAHSFNLKHTP